MKCKERYKRTKVKTDKSQIAVNSEELTLLKTKFRRVYSNIHIETVNFCLN